MHIMPWISLKCYNCFENQVCTLSLKIQFIQQWTQKRKKKWCISKINKTTLQWCLISLRNQQPELSQSNTHTHKMNLNCTLQSLFSQIKWKTKIQHCKEICNGYADLVRIAFCCTHRNCKHYQSCHDLHLNTCVIIDWLTESSFCFWNICTQWVLQIKT